MFQFYTDTTEISDVTQFSVMSHIPVFITTFQNIWPDTVQHHKNHVTIFILRSQLGLTVHGDK